MNEPRHLTCGACMKGPFGGCRYGARVTPRSVRRMDVVVKGCLGSLALARQFVPVLVACCALPKDTVGRRLSNWPCNRPLRAERRSPPHRVPEGTQS